MAYSCYNFVFPYLICSADDWDWIRIVQVSLFFFSSNGSSSCWLMVYRAGVGPTSWVEKLTRHD